MTTVDRKRAENAKAYAKKKQRNGKTASRKRQYPTTLILPVCGSCGQEMCLNRGGKYRNYWCANGQSGKHGCTFRGSKSVRIIENSILEHLRGEVLTPEFVQELVAATNRQIAAAPPVETDTEAFQRVRSELVETSDRLTAFQEQLEEGEFSSPETLLRAIAKLEQKRDRLKEQESQLVPRPTGRIELTEMECGSYLEDLRDLLRRGSHGCTGPPRDPWRYRHRAAGGRGIQEAAVVCKVHPQWSSDCVTPDAPERLSKQRVFGVPNRR